LLPIPFNLRSLHACLHSVCPLESVNSWAKSGQSCPFYRLNFPGAWPIEPALSENLAPLLGIYNCF